MLSTKNAKWLLHLLIPLFIALFSIFICAQKVPELPFCTEAIESLDESKDTITKLTAGTMALSLAITFLPDDYGSSLANSLTDLDKYFVLLLVAIFLERLIAIEGSALAFTYLIPAACLLYVISFIFNHEAIQIFAKKIAILALAIVLVVPCGTHLANTLGKDYLDYVDTTIEESSNYSSNVSDSLTNDDASLIEKIKDSVSLAVSNVKELASNIKNVISKFMNSIAILIVTTCVVPALMFVFFLWILQQIFSLDFSKTSNVRLPKEWEKAFQKLSSEFKSEDKK